MFALNISQNGKDYKAYFQNGRLRRYKDLPLAKNASKQLLNNTKNNIHTVEIFQVEDNTPIMFVTKESTKIVESKYSPCVKDINIPVTKKRENTVPLESLIEKKDIPIKKEVPKNNTDNALALVQQERKDRIQFLKDCHEKHKKKVEQRQQVNVSNSINNLTDPKVGEKSKAFLNSFTAKVLEIAIKDNDYKTLFNTEIMLAQKGYSWYPDENNNIQIAPTEKVLEIINKRK